MNFLAALGPSKVPNCVGVHPERRFEFYGSAHLFQRYVNLNCDAIRENCHRDFLFRHFLFFQLTDRPP